MIAVLQKSKPANFAELLERLGGVPLERILMEPFPGSATVADLENHKGPTCELIDGVLVEKAMGDRESLLGIWIATQLINFVEPDDLGVVFGEAGLFESTMTKFERPMRLISLGQQFQMKNCRLKPVGLLNRLLSSKFSARTTPRQKLTVN